MDNNIAEKNLELAKEIIGKANMSARPAFYSGRGALSEDFEFGKPSLNVIFNELRKIDEKYAVSFIELVMTFNNLNATDFLTSFYSFAQNSFSLENTKIKESGYSLETVGDEQRDAVAFMTIVSAFGSSSERDDTKSIKARFLDRLPDDILKDPRIKLCVNSLRGNPIKTIGGYYSH